MRAKGPSITYHDEMGEFFAIAGRCSAGWTLPRTLRVMRLEPLCDSRKLSTRQDDPSFNPEIFVAMVEAFSDDPVRYR